MENKKKVFVIIVNWNGKQDTESCLNSLERIEKTNVDFHCIVVDNGSRDDSVVSIRKKYPWAIVLPTGENLGFTGGNNVGIIYALEHETEYIWLLNNDTIVDRYVLKNLIPFKDPHVGICGSKIYFAPKHEFHLERYRTDERGRVFWYAGGHIDWANMYASHRGVDEVDHGQFDTEEETPFVTGCSMMIRARVFDRIGLLDDRYYLYLEELDFCLRAKKVGFTLRYVPSSVLWHVNAGSSARPGNLLQQYYITRNRLLIGQLYASKRTQLALFRESIRFIFSGTKIQRKAVLDAWSNRFGNRFRL